MMRYAWVFLSLAALLVGCALSRPGAPEALATAEPAAAEPAPEAPAEPQGPSDFEDPSIPIPAAFAGWEPGKEKARGANFHRIPGDRNNYRSAILEKDAEFYELLRDRYGIRTIVNVREADYGEKDRVEAAGLEYRFIRMTDEPPTPEEWEEIQATLDAGNTLIHCTHGADRTGCVIGRYLVERDLMTVEEAYDDALGYGFKRWDSNRFLRCFIEKGPDPSCYR